jgi:hypothetical protein
MRCHNDPSAARARVHCPPGDERVRNVVELPTVGAVGRYAPLSDIHSLIFATQKRTSLRARLPTQWGGREGDRVQSAIVVAWCIAVYETESGFRIRRGETSREFLPDLLRTALAERVHGTD